MYAGYKDALSLLGMSSGLFAAMPWAAANPRLAMVALLAAASGAGGIALKHLLRRDDPVDPHRREGFVLRSDEPPPASMGPGGLRLGYTTDENLPVDLGNELSLRHLCIVGQSGVGKTVAGEHLLWQQTVRGGGWLFIDAKLDKDTRDRLWTMVNLCDRADDFYVINPAEAANCNTYNPILQGSGDEVASRLLNLIPSTEHNPGADHYRQAANQALICLVNALKVAGYAYHFGDLTVLLQSPRALEQLARVADPSTREARALQVFLSQYRVQTKEGTTIDMKKLRDTFGGIAGRIATFAQGGFGQVFNTYRPEIDMTDVIRGNKMLYVMLPTMGRDVQALNFAKMCVSDLRTGVAHIQALTRHLRPNPPFLAFLDEFGSYVLPGVARLFEQARSANICMIPAFQTFANLSAVSPDFADMIVQNTWTKLIFKFGSQDADNAAELLGKSREFALSLGEGDTQGSSMPLLRTAPTAQESGTHSMQRSYRMNETYRVSPDKIRALGLGECFAQVGARMYHLNIPRLRLPHEDELPEYRAVRRNIRIAPGLAPCGYEDRYREFISHPTEP